MSFSGCRGTVRLAALAATTLIIAGCGGDGGGEKIPAESAQAMKTQAAEIGAALAAQECDVAQSSTTELRAAAEALPEDTDPSIVDRLDAMITRIDDQLDVECTETGTSDETTTTEPETTEVTPTTTTPTTTTTTTAPPEEEEPETPEQPPGEGGGPAGPKPKPTPPGPSGGPPDTGGVEEE